MSVKLEAASGLEVDEDEPCSVCLSIWGEDTNEIVFCDKCNVATHQACYGMMEPLPAGDWFCDKCSAGQSGAPCAICPEPSGAMKLMDDGKSWIHLSCMLWVPGIFAEDNVRMKRIHGLNSVDPRRFKLKCMFCNQKGGAAIQCGFAACKNAFHVGCAFSSRTQERAQFLYWDDGDFDFRKAYCPEHLGQFEADRRWIIKRVEVNRQAKKRGEELPAPPPREIVKSKPAMENEEATIASNGVSKGKSKVAAPHAVSSRSSVVKSGMPSVKAKTSQTRLHSMLKPNPALGSAADGVRRKGKLTKTQENSGRAATRGIRKPKAKVPDSSMRFALKTSDSPLTSSRLAKLFTPKKIAP